MYTPSYQIKVEKREVVLRFPRDIIDETALGRFLDFLEFESIRKRSQLTEDEAAELANEIDAEVWQNLKSAFIGG